MASEVREQRMGAATVMARLADIIVTRVICAWAETRADAASGWLAAIRDPQIGAALAAFHRQYGFVPQSSLPAQLAVLMGSEPCSAEPIRTPASSACGFRAARQRSVAEAR